MTRAASRPDGTAREVLAVFLRMGLTCFGGPVAHIGYFREEIVKRRGWLGEQAYADLVALCQFLPGPASSKLGFSLGLLRAGYGGALAAWLGFTLPSALLMFAFAQGAGALPQSALAQGALHGLKLMAVAIVAQAVWGMARTLCPDRLRASIGTGAFALLLLLPGALGQSLAIAAGALLGLLLYREDIAPLVDAPASPVSRRVGFVAGALFLIVLAAAFLPWQHGPMALFFAIYRSGALVFGGGHVVLPLLDRAVVAQGWVTQTGFLNAYGAVQAVPGPLFTFATALGALAGGAGGALLATVAIFLPGMLLQLAALSSWDVLRGRRGAQAAVRGINAAVVGLLGAALYNPVWTGAVLHPADLTLAFAGLILLVVWRWPPILVVVALTAAGMVQAVV